MAKGGKIERIKKNRRLDLGLVIFAFIFLYLIICIYLSSKETNIVGYQVKNGSLSENRTYSAIALRKENVVTSEVDGYISLFVTEGERAAFNNVIYCIDESGKMSDINQKDPTVSNSLESSQLSSIKQEIEVFSKNFDERNFSDSYTFENTVIAEVNRLENRKMLANIDEINAQHLTDVINFYKLKSSGIVTFYNDGYEEKTAEELNKEDFDKENYKCHEVFNDDLIETGDFVYKYVNDENWSLTIWVPIEERGSLIEDDYVRVLFTKTQTESWGHIHIAKETPEGLVVELSFTNSMVTFAKERFVDIELLMDEDSGLKIPNTAIADASFFLIDKAFVIREGNLGNHVNRQVVSESGEIVTKITEITIYDETENEYYVGMSALNIGDTLIYTKSDESVEPQTTATTFTVGKQGTLKGVYNINKGYADFKKIKIKKANDEYSIIDSNTTLGLRAYDFIALDSSVVTDKDFVY